MKRYENLKDMKTYNDHGYYDDEEIINRWQWQN